LTLAVVSPDARLLLLLGEGLIVLRRIKRMLDPNGIMNLGVLIPEES
jgi:FAD/FMN-containing dehydrogenase